MGRRYDAQANLYNPEPMSAGQAQALGHPEWEGLKLDARDAERLVGGAARNQTTLQTHFGGQQRTCPQTMPQPSERHRWRVPACPTMSISGCYRARSTTSSGIPTTSARRPDADSTIDRNNSTRITTTGMRDDTSEANSDRAHPGGGAPKPIPAGVRDRIESQKTTAINKARAAFDNGESSMDDYLDNWQQAQNDYEDRIQRKPASPIPHYDIRSNVDAKGNWIGNRSAACSRSATSTAGRQPSFVTPEG